MSHSNSSSSNSLWQCPAPEHRLSPTSSSTTRANSATKPQPKAHPQKPTQPNGAGPTEPTTQPNPSASPSPSTSGKDDPNLRRSTIVHEIVAPAVTHEHIQKQIIEEESVSVDRAIHQAHYHTSVQPIHDAPTTLATQHERRTKETEHRERQEGNETDIRARLEAEQATFRDERTERTEHSRREGKVIEHERLHHHVYEQIQPVIQREVIAPTLVHTIVPVHEVVYKEPQHHAASALPAISMAEFKKQGGVLGGRGERRDEFEGEPIVDDRSAR